MAIDINIQDLLKLTSSLLSQIQKQNPSVQIQVDAYWDMKCKYRYNTHGVTPQAAAVHLITPKLSDALAKVNQMLQGTLASTPGGLIYIAPLLMAIGEEWLRQACPDYCNGGQSTGPVETSSSISEA